MRVLPLLLLISSIAGANDRFMSIVGQGDQNIADVDVSGGGKNRLTVNNYSDVSDIVAPMINRVDVASAARTTSSNSGALDTAGMGSMSFDVNVTAVSGTTPQFQVFVESSEDGVNNWSTFMTTRRFTATGNEKIQQIAFSTRYYRYRWVISGTTPSFTFSITTTLKDYMPKRAVKVQFYSDIDLSTDNALSTPFNSAGCSNVTVISKRGADGGNGAQVRIQVSQDNVEYDDLSANIAHNASTTVTTIMANQALRFYRFRVESETNAGTRTLDLFWGCN